MNVIVITWPEAIDGEGEVIARLLDSGAADRVHLRRPSVSAHEIRRLIESVPSRLYDRLSVHSHFDLAARYSLGGIHIKPDCQEIPDGFTGLTSSSCHSLGEVGKAMQMDYVFLSPVFDSISKPGYMSGFSTTSLFMANGLYPGKIVALGGVTPEHLPVLRELGFAGVAMLGCVWNACRSGKTEQFISGLADMRKQLNI